MKDTQNPEDCTQTQVVGLYSFPKSGNTWLRAIIAGATGMPAAADRLQHFVPDTHYGNAMERPWSFQNTNWYFYKSHKKTLLMSDWDGSPLHTDKVLYVYRHPLDVFCSYLNFASNRVSPNAGLALPFQYDSVEALSEQELNVLFTIFLKFGTLVPRNTSFGGIFEHVRYFRQRAAKTGAVHIMRYEDLFDDFETTIQSMCGFLGMGQIDTQSVYDTADKRTQQNGRFFWKRKKENFRGLLSEPQITRFFERWQTDMREMGYNDGT